MLNSPNAGKSSSPYRERKRGLYYGWIVLAALFLVGAVSFGIRFSFGVFFNAWQDDFGWSRGVTSGIFSIYMLLCAAASVLSGWLTDRYGPRIVVPLAGFFTGLCLILTSRADALWQFYLTFSLLLALGTGGVYVVTMSTVSKWFVEKRGLVMGIAGAGGGLGMLITAPVAAQLISTYDWRIAFLVIGVAAWIIIIGSGLLVKTQPGEAVALINGETAGIKEMPAKVQQAGTGPAEVSLRGAARAKDFWLLLSSWFLFSICLNLVTTHLVPFGRDVGLPALEAAALLSLTGGISVPGRVIMGRASDLMGRRRTLVIASLIQTAAMLSLAYATSAWILFLFAAVYGFVRGGVDVCIGTTIAERFGLLHVGIIMGALSMGYTFGAAIGPILGGYIFDVTSSYQIAFLIGGVASLLMAAAGAFLDPPQHKREPEGS